MGRWEELIPICEDISRNDYKNITYGKIAELTKIYLNCELDGYVVDLYPLCSRGSSRSVYPWDDRGLNSVISVDELVTSYVNVRGNVFDDRKRSYFGSQVMCESGCISFIEWCRGLGDPGFTVLTVLFLVDIIDRVACCGYMGSDFFFSRIYPMIGSEKKKRAFCAFRDYLDLAACLNFDTGVYTVDRVDEILKKVDKDFRNTSFGNWSYEDILPSYGLFVHYHLLRGRIVVSQNKYRSQMLLISHAYNSARDYSSAGETQVSGEKLYETIRHYLGGSFVYYDWEDWFYEC